MEIVNGMLSRVQLRYRMDAHTHTHTHASELVAALFSRLVACQGYKLQPDHTSWGRAVVLGADRVLYSESKERSAGAGAH